MRVHVRHGDAHVLDALADEEVAALNVLGPLVVLRIVGQVAGAGVVRAEFILLFYYTE